MQSGFESKVEGAEVQGSKFSVLKFRLRYFGGFLGFFFSGGGGAVSVFFNYKGLFCFFDFKVNEKKMVDVVYGLFWDSKNLTLVVMSSNRMQYPTADPSWQCISSATRAATVCTHPPPPDSRYPPSLQGLASWQRSHTCAATLRG